MVWRADPARVAATFTRISWPWIAGAVLLVVADRTLMGYRWIALLAPLAPSDRPPLGTVLRIFFVSTFVGTFLPAGVGSDAVRTWSLARGGVPASQSLASVLIDRLLGVLSVLVSAAVGLMLAPDVLADRAVRWTLGLATAACLVGLAFVFSVKVDDILRQWLARRPAGGVHASFGRVLSALQAYRTHRGVLGLVLVASVAVQVLRTLQAWMLGRSLGIDVSLAGYFVAIPVIVLIMQLPVTVGGLGTSQVGFETMFSRFGVASPDAVALSLLFIALGVVGNLPGGVLYAAGWRTRRDP